jgi:hypothetical protein
MTIENKDIIAAHLTIAAMSMRGEKLNGVDDRAIARHVVSVFECIREHLEDGKELPKLPESRPRR